MVRKTEYELRKISDGVFDKSTFSTLYKLTRKGMLDELQGVISTGKEANVYLGRIERTYVAVKIYLVENSDFKTMQKYLVGDRRFSTWKNRRQLIYNWTKKEFKNLSRLTQEIRCPQPIGVHNNVLVMELIGNKDNPAPRLKDLQPKNPEEFYSTLREDLQRMHQKDIVHGDLSEYNILNNNEEPVIIDFSMGVLTDHPLADEFLRRDLKNVSRYFRKYGIKEDEEELYRYITQ